MSAKITQFVLDTSAYAAYNRGDARLKKWFSGEYAILVPLIVLGELRAGFAAGNKQEENEQLLTRFLNSPSVSTLTLTDTTTKQFAATYLILRKNGSPIGVNDLWIAALALETGIPLLTLDSDFERVVRLEKIKL